MWSIQIMLTICYHGYHGKPTHKNCRYIKCSFNSINSPGQVDQFAKVEKQTVKWHKHGDSAHQQVGPICSNRFPKFAAGITQHTKKEKTKVKGEVRPVLNQVMGLFIKIWTQNDLCDQNKNGRNE